MTNKKGLDFQLGKIYELLALRERYQSYLPSFDLDNDFEELKATYSIARHNADKAGINVEGYPPKNNIPNSSKELWEIL